MEHWYAEGRESFYRLLKAIGLLTLSLSCSFVRYPSLIQIHQQSILTSPALTCGNWQTCLAKYHSKSLAACQLPCSALNPSLIISVLQANTSLVQVPMFDCHAGGTPQGASERDIRSALSALSDAAEHLAASLVAEAVVEVTMPQQAELPSRGISRTQRNAQQLLHIAATKHAILEVVCLCIWESFPKDHLHASTGLLSGFTSETELQLALQQEQIRAQHVYNLLEEHKSVAEGAEAGANFAQPLDVPYFKMLSYYTSRFQEALNEGMLPHPSHMVSSLDEVSSSPTFQKPFMPWQFEVLFSAEGVQPSLAGFERPIRQVVEAALECSVLVSMWHTRLFKLHVQPYYGVMEGTASAAAASAKLLAGIMRQGNEHKGAVQYNSKRMMRHKRLAAPAHALPGEWAVLCHQPGLFQVADSVLQMPGLLALEASAAMDNAAENGGSGTQNVRHTSAVLVKVKEVIKPKVYVVRQQKVANHTQSTVPVLPICEHFSPLISHSCSAHEAASTDQLQIGSHACGIPFVSERASCMGVCASDYILH
jgi:hypothetical protein